MRPYRPLKKAQPKPTTPARAASDGPRLSLCMIVKNEAKTLDKCLSLARPHVDEIVVLDTGSTDGTQAIAQRYADVYDEIEWPGSFATARNLSLDRATGDFILILDGDEWIERDESWAMIRQAIAQPGFFLGRLAVRNILGTGLVESDLFHQERLYPNHPLIRYSGRIHNQIADSLEAYHARFGGRIYDMEAEVTHVGYSYGAAQKKDKYAPRVALLEQELADAPTPALQVYYAFQLAVFKLVLEDFDGVLALADTLDYGLLTTENAYYAHQIATEAAFRRGRPGVAAAHGDAMLALNRDEPVGYYVTGIALLSLDHPLEGVLMLAEAGRVNGRVGDKARFKLNTAFVLGKLADLFAQMGAERPAAIFRAAAADPATTPAHADALLDQLQSELILSGNAEVERRNAEV